MLCRDIKPVDDKKVTIPAKIAKEFCVFSRLAYSAYVVVEFYFIFTTQRARKSIVLRAMILKYETVARH